MREREIRLERTDLAFLRNRWQDVCIGLGLNDKPGQTETSVFERTIKPYTERKGFRNLDQPNFMLRLLSQYRSRLKDPLDVDFAVFFRGVCYVAGSFRNEEDSARFAQVHLAFMGADNRLISNVSGLIMATRDHRVVPGEDSDRAYFLDCERAIMGTDEASYREYAKRTALDSQQLGPVQFVWERLVFLQGLVGRRIFSTGEMHKRFHSRAQANIEREIIELNLIRRTLGH